MTTRDTTDDEDRADLAAFRQGSEAAFARLYTRHAGRLFGLARRVMGQDDQAEEAVQDAFIQLHRKADSFRGEARFSTWLGAIAINACRMRRRSQRRQPLPLETVAEPSEAPAPVRDDSLEHALAGLEPTARELLLLAAQGHSYDELAQLLGLSSDQVRGRLYRARKALLAKLEPGGNA